MNVALLGVARTRRVTFTCAAGAVARWNALQTTGGREHVRWRRCSARRLPLPLRECGVFSVVRAEAEPVSEALHDGQVGGESRFAGRFGTDRAQARSGAQLGRRSGTLSRLAPHDRRRGPSPSAFPLQPATIPVQKY